MTENDKIEYKSIDDLLKKPIIYDKSPRKIKFMQSSFIRIKALYNRFFKKFRINHVANKLEKNKDKLQSIEIPASDFQAKPGEISKGEQKITKLSKKVADLEARLTFLTRGIKPAEEEVQFRAIKLKNHMMKNFVYNSDSVYSINPDIEDKIFDDSKNDIASSIVKEPNEDNEVVNLDRKEIKSAINKTFEQEEANENNTTSDMNDEIENEGMKDATEGIKVSRNGSTKARIDLNPDGTYHLRREEIDDELRVNRVDSKDLGYLKEEEQDGSQIYGEGDVSPFPSVEIKGGFKVESPEKIDSSEFNVKSGEGNLPPIEENYYSGAIKNLEMTTPKKVTPGNRVVPLIVPERTEETIFQEANDNAEEKFKFVDGEPTDLEEPLQETEDYNLGEPEIQEEEIIEENYKNKQETEDYAEEYPTEQAGDVDLHFDYSNTTPKDLENVVENAKNMGDLKAVLARVEVLKQAKKASEDKLKAAETEANKSEEELRKTEERLKAYSESLEADCNNNSQKEQELLAKRDENMAKIDAMMRLMTEQPKIETRTKGR